MEPLTVKCTVAHRTNVQFETADKASVGLVLPEEEVSEYEVGKKYKLEIGTEEVEEEEEDEDVVGRPERGNNPKTMHKGNVVKGSAAVPAEKGELPPIGKGSPVNPPRP